MTKRLSHTLCKLSWRGCSRHLLGWLQDKEEALSADLTASRNRVDAALLDSINLSGAMEALFDLVRSANRYMDEREASAETDKGVCGGGSFVCAVHNAKLPVFKGCPVRGLPVLALGV